MRDIKQSTATDRLVFMTDSADHVTGKTGLTLTITASKAGAAFASITPTVTERGSGWYALALTSSHTDTLGDLGLHITSTGADPADLLLNVVDSTLDDVATSAEIAGIGTAGGAAINTDATTDNAAGGITGVTSGTTKVGTETGTFANTSNINSVYHQITHSGNAIDWVYQFLTGGGTSVVSARWVGYISSGNDTITFYAWNHVGAAWESLGTQVGQAGTTNVTKDLTLYERHRGTSSAELGKVYIRLACTGMTAPVLYTDQLFVSYAVTSRSVGYANGAVWIDTVNGVAGTESFVNGVADNPVLTLADALTIATANRLRKFEIGNGSSLTLSATTSNKVLNGHEWDLALGGQDISSSMFIDAAVSGTSSGTLAEFEDCQIGTATIGPSQYYRCTFIGTMTIGATGDYLFVDCASQVAGAGAPVFDFGALGATTASFRRWSGGMTVNNIASGDIISIDAVSGGTITLNGADGNVQVRGMVNIVDNRTGTPTLGTTNNIDTRFNTLDAAVATVPTASENATALLDLAAGVETGLTLRQALRLLVAAEAGKLSGAATTTIVIRNAVADSKNRITATVDSSGNRSAITYDLT